MQTKENKITQACHKRKKCLKRNVHKNVAAKHESNTLTAVKKKTADHQPHNNTCRQRKTHAHNVQIGLQ